MKAVLTSKRLSTPSDIGTSHVEKVDVDSVGRNPKGFELIRHGRLHQTIGRNANASNAVQAPQRRWSVGPSKNNRRVIGNANRCASRVSEFFLK